MTPTVGETPDARRSSRLHLRRRWYDEGYFGTATLAEMMAAGAATHGATPLNFRSVGGETVRTTLAEIQARAAALAASLHRIGLRPGDAICVQLPNRVEQSVVYSAGFLLGLVVVPVVQIYGPSELGFIIEETAARALVIPDRWRQVDCLARVAALASPQPVEHLIVVGERVPPGAHRFNELAGSGSGVLVPPAPPGSSDDVCMALYTSGTTGVPKGVLRTHNQLAACVRTGPAAMSGEPGPASLFGSPAGHIGAVIGVLAPFLTGTPGTYLDSWDADEAVRMVAEHRLTRSTGAPLHLLTLIEAAETADLDVSSFHYYHCGGAPVPSSTVERAQQLGWTAARSYGCTEHPSMFGSSDLEPLAWRAGSDGGPAPGVVVRLVDGNDRPVARGTEGEILSIGPKQSEGYWDTALDDASFTADGWFRTGDIGVLDSDGRLTITDRKKDLVVRAGENISSQEVERALVGHPDVLEAAVVGLPDPRFGERVCAFVRLRAGSQLNLEEVSRHFAGLGLARQKTPERLIPVDDFPRTATGKVRKADLRAGLERDPEGARMDLIVG
ncbi:MAG TPA: AMP-binding protein [Acidimicrobiales bacterium]|nr:AMP-binding protein [Acidimicrobiales bacterium]